ncbi:MAG: TolC family protein [Bacteroidales bacterium]|nr:TolC family protein [Bacteroidales bacterium]
MKRWSLILSLLLSTMMVVDAQTVYTLDSCKAMALRSNLTVQNKRLAEESAREVKKAAFTKYFPSVSAVGVGFWLTNPMVDMNYDLGRWQTNFFSPISLSIDLPSIPMQMMRSGMMGGVTAVQPVFAGLRIVRGNQLAKVGVDAAALQTKMSADEVCTQVEYYYWQIVALQEKQKMLDMLDRQLARIGADVEAAVAAGVTTSNDILRVQLKQQELASGRLRVQNGIRTYKAVLRQTAQLPTADFEVAVDSLVMMDFPQQEYVDPEVGVSGRVESQLLDMQVRAAELQTQMKIGEYLPQVAVGAGYSAYLMDVNADNVASNHFGMVFGMVSVPLTGWWEGAHAIRQSRFQEQVARNERDNNLQLMAVQVQQSWNEYEEAYQQLVIAQHSIELAKDNLRMQQDFYEAGTTTLTELLSAQSMLQQSSDGFAEAYVNYQIARSQYLKNIGKY